MRKICLIALAVAASCGGSSGGSQYAATLTGAGGSTATGTAAYTVDGSTVSYTITYANLSGAPTAAHIHVGAAGVSGPVVVPFSGLPSTASGTFRGSFTAADVKAGTSGSTTVNAGSLDDLISAFKSGNAYTNIHTVSNASGEIRGQIQPK